MLTFVEKYGWNTFSQNQEDGLIEECLLRINPALKVAVEFGGADGRYCSNTAYLKHYENWKVYMYDIAPQSPAVEQKEITPANVNDLPECSVLSIDIDGNDYEVWKAYKGAPDIVVIEINSSLPPMVDHFSMERGSSYVCMLWLGMTKGYFLLVHTGNLVFVRNEHRSLFPEIISDGLENYTDYFNTNWLP